MTGLVIVGGSYAGLNIATSARNHGYSERIRILTNESTLPYHRPPLSKGYLLGTVDPQSLPLRGETFYIEQRIEVLQDTQVLSVDSARRLVTNQGAMTCDILAIATGARARVIDLPGVQLEGVVTLRSLADAEAIRERLPDVARVVIIGAGFIGLELAASLQKLGKVVTVLEGLPRVLARAVPPRLSSFIEAEHRGHGVDLCCNVSVAAIEGDHGKVTSVISAQGRKHPADMVVLAVGATPNIELGAALGLVSGGGIEVNPVGKTRIEHIYAAGDCTLHQNAFSGTLMRLESVQSATDQGKAAGAAIAGIRAPNESVPWFWSDQYDLKLQMVGLSHGADQEVLRGSVEQRKFSIFYLQGRRLIGIDSVNAPADHMLGRRLLAQRIDISPERISDIHFDLKSVLRAA